MKLKIIFVIVLTISTSTLEEEIVKRFERIKRDGGISGNIISTNDGIGENIKFGNEYKVNEIKVLVTDKKEIKESQGKMLEMNRTALENKEEIKDQLAVPSEKKVNKNRLGTKLTNIKNIVTHEDVEGHRTVLSEALHHHLHGPNEKVVFLSNDSDEDKLGLSIIETEHPHGQQVVVLPKTGDEHLSANYHLQQIGGKIAIFPTTPEEKVQKLHLLPSSIDASFQHPSGKVLLVRKSQENVLTNLHHIHSPSQKFYLLPKPGEELLNLHDHAAHQKVVLLPKTSDPLSGYHLQYAHHHHNHHDHLHHDHHLIHDHHALQPHHHIADHHDLHSHHDIHSHHDHHPHQKYILLPKGHEDTHALSHIGAHQLGPHSLGHNLHIHANGEKLIVLPKVTDETVAAINQLHAHSPGVVFLPRAPEEKLSSLNHLQSLFGNNEVAYKPYGNGYNLPISPHVLSTMNIDQGKVPVVVSNMLGLPSSGPQSLVTHLHKNLQQQISKNILPQLIKHVKLADHHIDKKHELDLGSAIHHHFTIIKKVGIPYIKPYPVQIEQRVPYPVIQRVPVLVDRPYKVHVIKPYPVLSPYIKNPEIPVKIPYPYPIKGPVVYNVPKSPILVSKPDHLTKSILIQKSEPVLIKHEKH